MTANQSFAPIDWGMLYARLMTACGYLPREIDDLAMHDVLALLRYWQGAPPAHEILAALHIARPAKPQADGQDPSGLGALIARYPDGRVKAS